MDDDVRIRKGWKLQCEACRFCNECAYYSVAEDEEHSCIVVDVNPPYVVVSTLDFVHSKRRVAQTFQTRFEGEENCDAAETK